MLTNKQKKLLHMIPARMGIDNEQRRTIQRNVGGFESAADKAATHEGFVSVMAFYESRNGGRLSGYTEGFWTSANERNAGGGGALSRLRWTIRNLAQKMGWTDTDCDTFLESKHCSSGTYDSLDHADRYWLGRCLDGMKAMAGRQP